MTYSAEDRMDDLRFEAMVEARLEAEYEAHDGHLAMGPGAEDADCFLCVEAAEADLAETVERRRFAY